MLPTLDCLRLTGTTVVRKQLKPAEGYEDWPAPAAKRAFVGGTFSAEHGVSAMELAAAASPLTARKSWFFFDDEVVCLTLWFDHGTQAKGATYAYAVAPNKTAGQMEAMRSRSRSLSSRTRALCTRSGTE